HAGDGLDATVEDGADDADVAGDGLDAAADLAAAVDEDVPAHRLEVAGDARLLPDADVAADAGQGLGLHAVAGLDVAADGARVLEAGAGAGPDVGADGLWVPLAPDDHSGAFPGSAGDFRILGGRKRRSCGR